MLKTILNPDNKIVKAIKERLEITEGMCPCIPEHQWNEDTKCICKEFREQKETGPCHCNLYFKV